MEMLATLPLDPILLGSLLIGLLYILADRRVRRERGRHAVPQARRSFFLTGLLAILVALRSPIDTAAATSFSIHMVQHLMLTMVAAPLLVLGAPITLAVLASTRPTRRRLLRALRSPPIRLLSNPIVAWALFMIVLWGTHLPGFYELTLTSPVVHALEHIVYLATAVLFWIPIVGVDPAPSGLSHPARILYLFLSMPAMAFLGLALFTANHALYATYARVQGSARALADQRTAGAIMWTATMFLIVPALAFVLFDWMRADEREAARTDARLLRERTRPLAPEVSSR
jgi:putative copper resistance protein D